METVTTNALINRTGLTYRQIDHWCRKGYLKPLERHSDGSGVHREFPRSEMYVAMRMRDLLSCGFTVPAAEKLARGDRSAMMRLDLTIAAVRAATS